MMGAAYSEGTERDPDTIIDTIASDGFQLFHAFFAACPKLGHPSFFGLHVEATPEISVANRRCENSRKTTHRTQSPTTTARREGGGRRVSCERSEATE